MRRTEALKLFLAFLAVYVIWGSTYLAIAVTVQSVPPVFMVAFRGALAGGLLYLWTRLRGGAPIRAREIWQTVPAAALLFGGGYVLVGWSELYVESGPVALLASLSPVFAVLLEWQFGRRARPGLLLYAGLAAGLLGVALLVLGRSGAGGSAASWALLLPVLASVSWGAGSVLADGQRKGEPLRHAALQLLTGALLLFPVSAMLGDFGVVLRGDIDRASLLALLYLVVFGSLIGYSAYVYLLQHVGAARATSHSYVNPLIAVLLGSWLAQEHLDGRTAVSALLIILSVATILHGKGARAPARGEPGRPALGPAATGVPDASTRV